LPDGNLNNPSLSWLRRWCEGKAKILAVISLPEETFRSADATVKASLVFLRRFTDDEQAAWEAAWAAAKAAHDAAFDAEHNALCATYGPRIISGDNKDVAQIVGEMAAIGVTRVPPTWFPLDPPPYPKGINGTRLRRPAWQGDATDRKQAAALRKAYNAAFTDAVAAASSALTRELQAALRALDERHNAALWAHVREDFDYPIFIAAPKAVGISSTGETGENVANDLPALLDAYRRFRLWAASGANPQDTPDFRLPSAA
jgi:type I restriction enzyme M protein